MDIDGFWKIIEDVKKEGGIDIEERTSVLENQLEKLLTAEIISFSNLFGELVDSVYTWDLWGAAYVIQGGCSDDGFWDFRSSLVSTGRKTFERAVSSPDSLAELESFEIQNLYFEGFQYVAQDVYEEITDEDMPIHERDRPTEPIGEDWDFDDRNEVKNRLPKLCDIFFNDN